MKKINKYTARNIDQVWLTSFFKLYVTFIRCSNPHLHGYTTIVGYFEANQVDFPLIDDLL